MNSFGAYFVLLGMRWGAWFVSLVGSVLVLLLGLGMIEPIEEASSKSGVLILPWNTESLRSSVKVHQGISLPLYETPN